MECGLKSNGMEPFVEEGTEEGHWRLVKHQ